MSSGDKMTVLAVGGHASDIFPNIGGTVAKHVRRGDNVVLLTLTYGVEVHTEKHVGKSVQEIKDIVWKQSMEAAKVLGVEDYRFLDFGDTPLVSTREKLIELGETIQDVRPDIIISAHYPYRETGWGGDHGEAARMLEVAPSWRQHQGKHAGEERHHTKAIWFSMHDHTTSLNHPVYQVPNVYVDITDTIEQKIEACRATWATATDDLDGLDGLFRKVNGSCGFAAGVEYAECFERPWLNKETVDHLTT